MGQHPNGNGHFHQAPHWPQPPPYAYPPVATNGGGFSITKGYVPLMLLGPIVVAVGVGGWVVGSAWTKQQTAIEAVQTDVTSVKQDVRELRSEVKNSVTEIKSALERSPWYGEVKATAKR